jgi:uncharacterized protein involved in exopolysaccharide biosynthesis
MSSEKSLRELITGLRSELTQPHDLDEPTRRTLHELAQELERALDRPPGTAPAPAPVLALRERLADRVRELEASHPRLATTLGNIVDTLAFYGL